MRRLGASAFLLLLWAAVTGCDRSASPADAGFANPAEPFQPPVLAGDYGVCAPVARRASSPLVWCEALGGTCATPAACDFIDGGPPRPAEPPELRRAREPRLTVYLKKDCRHVVSGAVLFIDHIDVDTLRIGPPGLSVPVTVGSHTVAAEAPEGLIWEAFLVEVPRQGLIQPLTCR